VKILVSSTSMEPAKLQKSILLIDPVVDEVGSILHSLIPIAFTAYGVK
jgi:hypothetical protein